MKENYEKIKQEKEKISHESHLAHHPTSTAKDRLITRRVAGLDTRISQGMATARALTITAIEPMPIDTTTTS